MLLNQIVNIAVLSVVGLVDVSIFFFCSGEGKGSPRRREGGGGEFLWKIPGGGGGGGGGGEGPGGCLRGIWGWGAKYLFSGAEIPTK